eukprot:CAMPEP_0201508978 /NCGR_PEP_ID=MMETSP0161_2-20130828/2152_1 /ASSEMBLY_ACC=CAM_ASM_000251 /TAXON_ID=180227 /ORGANISM="Neoparamoeba aestuarina, Strain SoJaBio B1-5/56/2" /LENGTH=212 /DNA_ID=CAMNT_0047903791 /DNA_START=111 /DNA_END=749 /DNA_ORIENTATION=-
MSATNYSFNFIVNQALLDDMTNANLNIVAVKPTGGNTTPTVWFSLPITDVALGATVTVTWSNTYSVFFNATVLKKGSTTVTVTNDHVTSLGAPGPSAWTYGPNPTAWTEVPGKTAPDGTASVEYLNNDNATIGFAVQTEINGKTSNQPLGANGVFNGLTVEFTPHEVVFLYLQNERTGLALDISAYGQKFQFDAKPNGLNKLQYSNHVFSDV